MGASDTATAVVALIVSLIALLVTLMQLMASLFATAGGRHRCTETVIGPWGKFSKMKRHWLEARFEVFFMSPELRLASQGRLQTSRIADIKHGIPEGWWAVTDRNLSECFDSRKYESDGWGAFLAYISSVTPKTSYRRLIEPDYTEPAIFPKMRTWDALPIDVSRPIASTTLHDIAVLANRMGLIWEHFEPESGNLLAQGGPRVLSSLEIRGLGLALSYRNISSSVTSLETQKAQSRYHAEHHTNMVRDERVDKFSFGMLPIDSLFCPRCHKRKAGTYNHNPEGCTHDVIVREREDRLALWNTTFELSSYHSWDSFLPHPQDRWTFFYSTNDVIHMCAPMLRWEGVSIEIFPLFSWYTESMLSKSSGRITFFICLQRHISIHGSQHLRNILATAEKFQGKRPWKDGAELSEFARVAHQGWLYSSNFLSQLETQEGCGFCLDLLRAHLSISPSLCKKALKTWKDGLPIRDAHVNSDSIAWRSEQVHLLFDNIPHYTKFMEDAGWTNSNMVIEAWITLLFRGICWAICHVAAEAGTQLSAKYYASMMPVYRV